MKQRVAKAQLAYTTRDRYGTSNSGGPDIGIAICDNEDEDAIGSEPEQRCARDTKIVVIAENRAREICICMMRTSAMYSLEVQVLSDSHSYSETLAAAEAIEPQEILLHDGTRSSTLSQKLARLAQQLQQQCSSSSSSSSSSAYTSANTRSSTTRSSSNSSSGTGMVGTDSVCRILYINRQYFDQDRGAELLRRLSARSIDSELVSRYTVLGACHCLLRYVESVTGIAIAPHSLRIDTLGGGGGGGGVETNITSRSTTDSAISTSTNTNTTSIAIGSGHMYMDRRTASHLEVALNARSGKQKDSLFGAINYTRTVVGARLLRANLLRPITDIPTLNMRLDAVDALVAGTLACTDLTDVLVKFPDLDQTLSGLATAGTHLRNNGATGASNSIISNKSNTNGTSTSSRAVKVAIDTLICIKHSIQQGHRLAGTIDRIIVSSSASTSNSSTSSGADANALLGCISSNLRHPSLTTITEAITALLTDGVAYSRTAHEMRHQECFAVRSNVHTFLDVSRGAFLQTVNEIQDKAAEYAHELATIGDGTSGSGGGGGGGGDVRVAYSATRGYYLQIYLPTISNGRSTTSGNREVVLPRHFIQAVQSRRVVSCTTNELLSLSSRALEAIETALRITNELVQDLLASIRAYSDVLFVFVDSIALLDMLQSFAELVHSCPHVMCRPRLTTDGALVIKEGRHPIMSLLGYKYSSSRAASNITRDNQPFVPNDTFISESETFQIITGGNGAGKSTYIKQVALLCILAQIGCYVPASHMTLPIRRRLLSRIGTGDDMEHNMSTFHTEMRECGYILDMADRHSLVIIDELGRGTANAEGLAIAMAVAEALVASGAIAMFVTHFAQLTSLEEVYPTAVCNVHLGTVEATDSSSSSNSNSSAAVSAASTTASGSNTDISTSAVAVLHRMSNGPSPIKSGYGLIAAQKCGFTTTVLDAAHIIHRKLKQLHPLLLDVSRSANKDIVILHSLMSSLSVLKSSTLDSNGVRFYLSTIANKLSQSDRQCLLKLLLTTDTTSTTDAATAIDATTITATATNVVRMKNKADMDIDIYTDTDKENCVLNNTTESGLNTTSINITTTNTNYGDVVSNKNNSPPPSNTKSTSISTSASKRTPTSEHKIDGSINNANSDHFNKKQRIFI